MNCEYSKIVYTKYFNKQMICCTNKEIKPVYFHEHNGGFYTLCRVFYYMKMKKINSKENMDEITHLSKCEFATDEGN